MPARGAEAPFENDPKVHALRAAIQKLQRRKRLVGPRHRDLLDDLYHELLVDYLEHTDAISLMTPDERDRRWLRLLDRHHYRLRIRGWQTRGSRGLESAVAEHGVDAAFEPPYPIDDERTRHVIRSAAHLKNGRLNATATGARLGLPKRDVRTAWIHMAEEFGFDRRFLAFWRRRLVEALLGLAADLLRDARRVRVHDEARRSRPDPRGRLRRIRAIKSRLSVRPLPSDMKSVLAEFTGRGTEGRVDARAAVAAAHRLQPSCPAVQLWGFETAIADGDPRSAASALLRARQSGADRIRLVLARARLLEARGKIREASGLLRRATWRHRDERLQASLRAFDGGV